MSFNLTDQKPTHSGKIGNTRLYTPEQRATVEEAAAAARAAGLVGGESLVQKGVNLAVNKGHTKTPDRDIYDVLKAGDRLAHQTGEHGRFSSRLDLPEKPKDVIAAAEFILAHQPHTALDEPLPIVNAASAPAKTGGKTGPGS